MSDASLTLPGAAQPLRAGYQRLLGLCPAVRVELLDDHESNPSRRQGWYSAAELIRDPDALAAVLAGEAARIAADHGKEPRPHVSASRLLHHYVWTFCLLVGGPWYLDRRVPSITPESIWLHAATGDLALRPRGYTALPGDPAGVIVAGEDELRAELRTAVVTHVEPLLEAFAKPTKRGTRALWGMVTDDLASAVWYLGRMLGEEEASVAAATAVLPGGTLPMPGAADFRILTGPTGRTHHTRTRLGCCLYYAVQADAACLTCPRTCDEDRVERLER
ncbi:iron-sulfur protein [Kitasatospora sp. NPDC054939]